jgi:gluconolactonase
MERIATGFKFVEGPTWRPASSDLVFSDIIGNVMYCWQARDGVSVFRRPSHMANGTTQDCEGRLLICEHATSRVSRVDADGRNYEVLASHFQGHELNSPNDLVVKSDGVIYFTDPNSGRGAKYGVERKQEQPFQGVYRLVPGGELSLLVDDFSKPNGLCFSNDESLLFINDTDRQHIRVFDVKDDGGIENGRVWAETGGDEPGVADGMKMGSAGDLYCCGSGGIHVFDPDGEPKGIIRMPEVAANFTWGGADLSEMYITATHSVYRLQMEVTGITKEVD